MTYRTSLEDHLQKNPPASVTQARARIKELRGIERSLTQVRALLKRIGLKRRKVGTIPAKADIEEQSRFKQEELEPRLEEAKAGKRTVFFMDAAHFVLAPFLGFLWSCDAPLYPKAPSGRQRFNVLGALNAITYPVFTFTNPTYITAVQVCELLTSELVQVSLVLPGVSIHWGAAVRSTEGPQTAGVSFQIDSLMGAFQLLPDSRILVQLLPPE